MISKVGITKDDYNLLVNDDANKFNSTMLDIYSDRAINIAPSTILKNYQNKYKIYGTSLVDPRIYNHISNVFFDSVSDDFECIELSPVNPFGLNSVLTNTNQNNVLSASRNSEVISDSSIAMALECAYRIKNLKIDNINLASSTRLLRTQNYGSGKKSHWNQHFRACSLVSSFRNISNNMMDTLLIQIDNWMKVIKNLQELVGISKINLNICYIPLVREIYSSYMVDLEDVLKNSVNPDFDVFKKYGICLPDMIDKNKIDEMNFSNDCNLSIKNAYDFFEKNIMQKLKLKYPNINCCLQINRKSGLNYYDNLCYEIEVIFENEKKLVLVDGGVTNWIGDILSDKKEKCVTSGMGLEYLGKVYRR